MKRDFYLSSLDIPVTEEYDFSYAGVSGYAEVIGCKVAFFRKEKSGLLDAFSFMETEPEEYDFCNSLLENIGFPVRFGDSHDKVRGIFGTEDSVDDFFEDYKRYNYSGSPFMTFCIKDGTVTGIDVVFSDEIISGLL